MFLYDSTFHLFKLNFLFFTCHDAVLMLCFGLGTKPTWLGLGNNHGMTSTNTDRDSLTVWFWCHRLDGNIPTSTQKTPAFVTSKTAEKNVHRCC